jgi:Zn-dependent protease with chaperone function
MAAYSWRDGRVRVTRGLLAAVDDDELSAAVAHELAHLLADGHLRSRASALRGSAAAGLDVESRADRLGRELLAACEIDPQAMVRLLERLAASATASSPRLRNQLRSRIEVLATTPAP